MFKRAMLSDTELKEIIENIRTDKNRNTSFEKLVKELMPTMKFKALSMINKYQRYGLTYSNQESLIAAAQYRLYLFIKSPTEFKMPEKNIFDELKRQFSNNLSKRLIQDVYLFEAPHVTSPVKSPSTLANIRAVARFIQEYRDEHKKHPSIQEIMDDTGLSQRRVETYLRAMQTYAPRKLQELVGGSDDNNMTLEDYINDKSQLPDEKYIEEEDQKILHDALDKAIDRVKNLPKYKDPSTWDTREISRNFDDIVKMLIDNNGKHHEEIRDKYGMSHKKPISRLWNEIIEEVHADRSIRKIYINKGASDLDKLIRKLAKQASREMSFNKFANYLTK